MRYYTKNRTPYRYCLWIGLLLTVTAIAYPASARGSSSAYMPVSGYRTLAVWETDLEVAVGRSQVSMKPILLFFTGPNCPVCDHVKRFSLNGDALQPLLRRFECVEINIGKQPEMVMLARVRSIPSFLVVEPRGRIKGQFDGDITAKELGRALILILTGDATVNDTALLIEQLKTGGASSSDWRKALISMQDGDARKAILSIAEKLSPSDRKALVSCLADDQLAVRLGALELLEELNNTITGLDPWTDPQADDQQAALKQWQDWNAFGAAATSPATTLSRETFERYMQDLIGDAKDGDTSDGDALKRSRYALRILANGGESAASWIVDYMEAHPRLDENALRRVKEVQYALVIPTTAGRDPLTVAHRLIWGSQDVQIRTIRQLTDSGMAVAPVMVDLLAYPEPVVREAAVETLFATAGSYAVEPVREHLLHESDPDIIFTILRHLGDTETQQSQEILESFFSHENEDLAIVAIEGAVKLSIRSLAEKLIPLLEDPRWRVKVAVLQALKKKGGREADIINRLRGKEISVASNVPDAIFKCLDDSDAFVRHTAAVVLGEMKISNAGAPLKKAYRNHDDMHGVIVSVLFELGLSVPGSYIDDLFGPDPNDLLFVLDSLENIDSSSRSLIRRAAKSENPDIACTALRIVARAEGRNAMDNALLANALHSGSTEKQLTVIQDFDVSSNAKKSLREEMKKSLLPVSEKALVSKATNDDILYVVAALMTDATVPDLVRNEAMVLLCDYGYPTAFKRAEEQWSALTPSKRTQVADTFWSFGKAAIPLFVKALADTNAKVWQKTVAQLGKREGVVFADPLSKYLLNPASRLRPAMIWPFGLVALCSENPKKLLPFAKQVLTASPTHSSDLAILALSVYTNAGTPEKDKGKLLELTKNEDPFVRRAAWIALTGHAENELLANVEPIKADVSKYVREIIPTLLKNTAYEKALDLYFSEDECFSGYESLKIRVSDSDSYKSRKKLNDDAVQLLEGMIKDDRDPMIRFRCMLTLLSHHIPLDLNTVAAAGRANANHHSAARLTADLFSQQSMYFGKIFSILLPLLETPDGQKYGEYESKKFRARWGLMTQQPEHVMMKGVTFKSVAKYAPVQQKAMAVFVEPFGYDMDIGEMSGPAELVFFTTSGCRYCSDVERFIKYLQYKYTGLHVTRIDIHTSYGMRQNEVLSRKFNVDPVQRAAAPSIFMSNGYLIDKEITYGPLDTLIKRSVSGIDGVDVLSASEDELKAASASIHEYGRSYAWYSVAGAGYADGKNYCLLVTLFLLLLHLFSSQQKGWAVARFGAIYLAALTGTTLLLWLGLRGMISKIDHLDQIGGLLNWLMVVSMLFLTLRYFFGTFGSLRKKKKKKALKRGKKIRMPRYQRILVVCVLWGVVVAILNLASIGNPYTQTIMYMIKSQALQIQPFAMLIVYSIVLMLPSAVILLTCSAATGNEQFQSFATRHPALIKFLLSILWFALFAKFVQYSIFSVLSIISMLFINIF